MCATRARERGVRSGVPRSRRGRQWVMAKWRWSHGRRRVEAGAARATSERRQSELLRDSDFPRILTRQYLPGQTTTRPLATVALGGLRRGLYSPRAILLSLTHQATMSHGRRHTPPRAAPGADGAAKEDLVWLAASWPRCDNHSGIALGQQNYGNTTGRSVDSHHPDAVLPSRAEVARLNADNASPIATGRIATHASKDHSTVVSSQHEQELQHPGSSQQRRLDQRQLRQELSQLMLKKGAGANPCGPAWSTQQTLQQHEAQDTEAAGAAHLD